MTAGSLLTILFYVWLAITAFVAFVWYRRKANRSAEKPSSNRLRELNEREANKRVAEPDEADTPATVGVGARTTDEVVVDTPTETVNPSQVATAGLATGISAEDPTIDKPIDLNELLAPEIPSPGSDRADEIVERVNVETVNDTVETVSDTAETAVEGPLDDGLVIQPTEDNLLVNDHNDDVEHDDIVDDVDMKDDPDVESADIGDSDVTADVTADVDADVTAETTVEAADDEADPDQDSSDVDGAGQTDDSDRLILGALPVDEEDTAINLTELLSEFDLPHDLTPLDGEDSEVSDLGAHVTLVSNHGDAADVGTALADELEGLGYKFEPVGHDRGVAKRGSEVIAMRIIPDITASDVSDHYRSSGVSESAVVVEMWSGHSSPDQLNDPD